MSDSKGPARELEEIITITAWRGLARAAISDPDAEQVLLLLLEQRVGAFPDFLNARADDIWAPPMHLYDLPPLPPLPPPPVCNE